MAETESVEESGRGSVPDYGALAVDVVAEVAGPRARPPEPLQVADALARRAAGSTYAAIAEAIGVTEKAAALWCSTAARLEPAFDARQAKPRKIRKAAQAKPPREQMIGWRPRPGTRAVLEARAESEGRSLSALVQSAVDSYLQRKTAGVEILVREQLRKGLKEQLLAVAEETGKLQLELSRQGNNVNQLASFCNRYRELPVAITSELTANRAALAANEAALQQLISAVEKLAGQESKQ